MKKAMFFICTIIAICTLSVTAFAVEVDPVINTVKELLNDGESKITVTSMEEASVVWRDVEAYIDAISVTSETRMSTALVEDSVMYMTLPAELNAEFTPSEITALGEKAGSTVSEISTYVTEQLTYDIELLSTPEKMSLAHTSATAKGGMCTGKAICQGYSNLFSILAENAGIENIKVRGYSGKDYHVLNVVRIDGQLFAVDTTFCDSSTDIWIMLDWETYCSLALFRPVIDLELAFQMKYGN